MMHVRVPALPRRRALLAVSAALGMAIGAPALAQPAWPTKPVTLVVPYAPGGATDFLARLFAEKLQARLGQTVLIENKPGANTLLATKHVMQQPGDGYTLYVASSAWNQGPVLQPSQFNYDIVKDFTPVSLLAISPLILVVNPNLPVKNVKDLVALAKSKPGQLNVATTGVGATDHLAGELLANKAGIKMNFVPYKGGAPAVQDVIAGNADVRIDSIPSSKPHVDSGKLRALAITGGRTSMLPDLPAVSESVPGVYAEGFFGLVAPKGLPKAILDRLNKEAVEILALPDVVTRLRGMGLDPKSSTPDAWRDLAVKDAETWGQVIKAANIKIE